MSETSEPFGANDNRGWFRRALTIIAGSGIVLGALALSAPAASAEDEKPVKESTIRSECKAAGGEYTTGTVEGTVFSACRYKSIKGKLYTDFYSDGLYYGTSPK